MRENEDTMYRVNNLTHRRKNVIRGYANWKDSGRHGVDVNKWTIPDLPASIYFH